VRGITIPPHHGDISLQQLVAGESLPPLRLRQGALTRAWTQPAAMAWLADSLTMGTIDASGSYSIALRRQESGLLTVIEVCPLAAMRSCPEAATPVAASDCPNALRPRKEPPIWR